MATVKLDGNNKVTSLSKLKEYHQGKVIQIPSYSDGQEVFVRLRRPSLLKMAEEGLIPNALLTSASELFTKGNVNNQDNTASIQQMYELARIMAKASLVEPTWEELEEAGVEFTDDQISYIFSYSQSGVESLKNFR